MLKTDTKNKRTIEILQSAKVIGDVVAIVSCMRKFITTLNYLVKTNQVWETK